jgi:hypothetical protein
MEIVLAGDESGRRIFVVPVLTNILCAGCVG